MRYAFSTVFDDGSIELGAGDAWTVLRLLRLKRRSGGFSLSAITDRETGREVTEREIAASVFIVEG